MHGWFPSWHINSGVATKVLTRLSAPKAIHHYMQEIFYLLHIDRIKAMLFSSPVLQGNP